jgi:hypothetical protein
MTVVFMMPYSLPVVPNREREEPRF